ncbi:MAG: hypothetical protein WBZ31_04655 [Thiobacillus sp.]|jgi:hypothetical protein
MKHLLFAAALAAATAPALATDVGVSISIGQPGFYGQIDIGGYPPPQLLYGEPMVIERAPMHRPPIYLRVPPGHAKHWSKHCHEYNACGERVYFVQDNWYQHEYVPRYQERHGDNHGKHGNDHGNNGNGKHGDEHGNPQGHGSSH